MRRCNLCGSTHDVTQHHVGGQAFVAWFTMPFCYEHHARFHVLLLQAGVELQYTDDPIERIRRAFAAIKVCEWMLLEMLKKENPIGGKS